MCEHVTDHLAQNACLMYAQLIRTFNTNGLCMCVHDKSAEASGGDGCNFSERPIWCACKHMTKCSAQMAYFILAELFLKLKADGVCMRSHGAGL